MPQPPLSDAVVAMLGTDACAALAAIMIISNAHGELMAWAQRALNAGDHDTAENSALGGAEKSAPPLAARLKPRKIAKLNGGHGAYHARLRAKRDADDERLIEAMKQSPEASVGEWGRAIGKCRTATVQALHRLRDAGLIENEGGNWALVGPKAPAPKPAGWIEPLSANRVARHTAHGRVRGELTMTSV